MEQVEMNWLLGLGFLFSLIYIVLHQLKKRKLRALENDLKSSWGKMKRREFYHFDLIELYFRNSKIRTEPFHIISDQIQEDVDIHDLFKYLDRTTSKIGQQYLYYKLRTVQHKDKLAKFNELTNTIESDPKLRLNLQLVLSNLNSHFAYDLQKLIQDEVVEKPPFHKLLLPLGLASVIVFSMGFFNPGFFLLLIPLFVVNMVFHYKTKSFISYYLRAVYALNLSLRTAKKIRSYTAINNQIPKGSFIQDIQSVRVKTKFISFEKQLSNEFISIFWFLAELVKIQFNFEAIIFYWFINDIVKKKSSINELFQFLGEIDCAISVASVKYQNKTICTPNFVEVKEINVSGIVHPLLEDCIPNDLNLTDKSLLLTGSNMSGKSTFIRAFAISSITAQTLNIAFAKEFSIPFSRVYTSIRITDSINDGNSYYLREVLVIKKLIEASDQKSPCIFILDEIFKGTNTSERISGGKAILQYLNKLGHFVLVSTHDLELADLLSNKGFDLHHFSEEVRNNELHFDFKLKQGKMNTRNAIKILELYGYPSKIISDARETIKESFNEISKD